MGSLRDWNKIKRMSELMLPYKVQTSSNNSFYGTNFKSRVHLILQELYIYCSAFNDSTHSNSFEYILRILAILAIFQMTLFQGTQILHQLAIQSRMSFPCWHMYNHHHKCDIKFMLNFKIEITISSSSYCNSASL